MLVVTGGSGFIGSHLMKSVGGFDFSLDKGFDITNLRQLLSKTKGAEAVVHLAAETDPSESVRKIFATNVFGTLNVLEACRRNDVRKVVLSSSAAVYGDAKPPLKESVGCRPINVYGASKLAAEGYVSAYSRSYGMDAFILRLFNVYGPGCRGVVKSFISSAISGKPAKLFGDGMQTRDFVYVGDVVKAIDLFLGKSGFGVYNIGTGVETTINDLVRKISSEIEVQHVPALPGEITHSCADVSKASAAGFTAKMNLSGGLKETFRFFRK